MFELKGIAILSENIYDVKSYKDKHNEKHCTFCGKESNFP